MIELPSIPTDAIAAPDSTTLAIVSPLPAEWWPDAWLGAPEYLTDDPFLIGEQEQE